MDLQSSHNKWRIAHDSAGIKVTIGYVEAPVKKPAYRP
jgi:hypothetical protein